MRAPLPVPPIWADARRMAQLLCMAESTFREHVAAGRLPQGGVIGGKRLWRVADVDEALVSLLPEPKNTDPVMSRIRGGVNGPAKKARDHAA